MVLLFHNIVLNTAVAPFAFAILLLMSWLQSLPHVIRLSRYSNSVICLNSSALTVTLSLHPCFPNTMTLVFLLCSPSLHQYHCFCCFYPIAKGRLQCFYFFFYQVYVICESQIVHHLNTDPDSLAPVLFLIQLNAIPKQWINIRSSNCLQVEER